MNGQRLALSNNKRLWGVCGGFAEFFSIDPTLVRLGFLLATFVTGGTTIPVYIVAALVMPNADSL